MNLDSNIIQAFIKLSQGSILIPILTGIGIRKLMPVSLKIILRFFILTIFFEIQATIVKTIFHNNMPGQHLYTIIEFLSFSYFFYKNLNEKKIETLLILNSIAYLVVAFCDAFLINGIFEPNNISRTYSSFFLTLYALHFFYRTFTEEYRIYIWHYPSFWIAIGVLIYFSWNLFYVMLYNKLIRIDINLAKSAFLVHDLINIIANVLYASAFVCYKKRVAK